MENIEQDIIRTEKNDKEVFEIVKDKIENIYSKESKDIIRTEVVKKNYTNEDWVTDNAVERIKEKVEEYLKLQKYKKDSANPKARRASMVGTIVVVFVIIISFFVTMAYMDRSPIIYGSALMIFIGSIGFLIKQRKEYNYFKNKVNKGK